MSGTKCACFKNWQFEVNERGKLWEKENSGQPEKAGRGQKSSWSLADCESRLITTSKSGPVRSPSFQGALITVCGWNKWRKRTVALIGWCEDSSLSFTLFPHSHSLPSLVVSSLRCYSPKDLLPEPFNNPKAIYRDFGSTHHQVPLLTAGTTIAETPLFPQLQLLISGWD